MFIPSKDDGSFLDNSVFIGLSGMKPKYLFTLERDYYSFNSDQNKWIIPFNIYLIENNCLHLLTNSYNTIYQHKWFAIKAKDICKTINKIENDLDCTIYI